MKLKALSSLIAAATVAATSLVSTGYIKADTAYKVIGLTTDNELVTFGSKKMVRVKGVTGKLQGIDFRPATGVLYGVTDSDLVYSIDTKTGNATLVSKLTASFNGGFQSGFDFNPVVDRLRVVGSNTQNLRANVVDGVTIVDGALNYNPGTPATATTPAIPADVNVGKMPNITAAAYTNSFLRAATAPTTTMLFGIDYDLNVLVSQSPPNSGTLNTIGVLSNDFGPIGGFDIFTDAAGNNAGFVASGKTLYSIDLATGATTKLGTLSDTVVGLAVTVKTK